MGLPRGRYEHAANPAIADIPFQHALPDFFDYDLYTVRSFRLDVSYS
jgi:hypothetical protein